MKATPFALLAALALACSSTPEPKAPGTNPEDMTAEQHEAEAAKHHDEADEHRAMEGAKPGDAEKADHLREAQEHRDVAEQHEAAADEAKKSGDQKK